MGIDVVSVEIVVIDDVEKVGCVGGIVVVVDSVVNVVSVEGDVIDGVDNVVCVEDVVDDGAIVVDIVIGVV